MKGDLTKGPVMRSMLLFALPMIAGNLLQQCYNVADTLIVGQFLGPDALAAVGSSFTLMTFLTSILQRRCFFYPLRAEGSGRAEKWHGCIFPADRRADCAAECYIFSQYGLDSAVSSGSGRSPGTDAGIPFCNFLRNCRVFSL